MYELEIPYGESDEYLAKVEYWIRYNYADKRGGDATFGYELKGLKPNYNYADLKTDFPNHPDCKQFYDANKAELDKYFESKAWDEAREISPYED